MSLRIVIVGYGRMGKEIDALASSDKTYEVVERLDVDNNAAGEGFDVERLRDVDVAIDFTTASATIANLPRLAHAGVNVVIGTTNWAEHETSLKQIAADAGIGVVAAANFSLGVNIFLGMVERAAELMTPHQDFGAWIHETHHAAKIDAPSGTARTLRQAMTDTGYDAAVDMSSTRAGHVPGTHTVGFDGPFETITLTHTARDRATFARGALVAARWIKGKRGWFTMRDVLGLDERGTPDEKDHP